MSPSAADAAQTAIIAAGSLYVSRHSQCPPRLVLGRRGWLIQHLPCPEEQGRCPRCPRRLEQDRIRGSRSDQKARLWTPDGLSLPAVPFDCGFQRTRLCQFRILPASSFSVEGSSGRACGPARERRGIGGDRGRRRPGGLDLDLQSAQRRRGEPGPSLPRGNLDKNSTLIIDKAAVALLEVEPFLTWYKSHSLPPADYLPAEHPPSAS